MTTELFGGSGVLYYNCSSLSPTGNGSSWLTMPPCLAAILGRNWTLARLAHRFYWSDDVKKWLTQCVACVKRKSPMGRHRPLGNIPTGHRWDRIVMDTLDVCDPTPDGHRYILVIADYFSKWTEAFPMKNKCADTVSDLLVDNIILCFGMPLGIHSDQGREFENGLFYVRYWGALKPGLPPTIPSLMA